MSALLQIPKVLGTLRQKQDEDHMCMSYYKSQYHSQKYFSSLLSVLWENWFWNMWVLKHTWSSGMQPSDIIIFQHFTIEETEACKKHGVTFSQVAAGGIWPQAPWLQKGSEPLHYRGKKKKKRLVLQRPLSCLGVSPRLTFFSYWSQRVVLSYWCILISTRINQQPQHCPPLNFNHKTNTCTHTMCASDI